MGGDALELSKARAATGPVSAVRSGLTHAFGPRAWWVVPLNLGLCLLFIAYGVMTAGDPSRWFREGTPGTFLSVLMLALASIGSFKRAVGSLPRHIRLGWAIFGFTLALAACDDLFQFHERADRAINAALGLDPKGPMDALDDILVMLYAIPAMIVILWVWRKYVLETPRFFARLAVAGALFAGMTIMDLLGRAQTLEESLKVMSGTLIFAAVVGTPRGREDAEREPAGETPA